MDAAFTEIMAHFNRPQPIYSGTGPAGEVLYHAGRREWGTILLARIDGVLQCFTDMEDLLFWPLPAGEIIPQGENGAQIHLNEELIRTYHLPDCPAVHPYVSTRQGDDRKALLHRYAPGDFAFLLLEDGTVKATRLTARSTFVMRMSEILSQVRSLAGAGLDANAHGKERGDHLRSDLYEIVSGRYHLVRDRFEHDRYSEMAVYYRHYLTTFRWLFSCFDLVKRDSEPDEIMLYGHLLQEVLMAFAADHVA